MLVRHYSTHAVHIIAGYVDVLVPAHNIYVYVSMKKINILLVGAVILSITNPRIWGALLIIVTILYRQNSFWDHLHLGPCSFTESTTKSSAGLVVQIMLMHSIFRLLLSPRCVAARRPHPIHRTNARPWPNAMVTALLMTPLQSYMNTFTVREPHRSHEFR